MSNVYGTVDHSTIPAGTLVYKHVVLAMWPGSVPTLWRRVKEGAFPQPRTYVGRRPAWLIDDVRALVAGTWKPETKNAA